MATRDPITRREVTDPVALQTVVDQLRERVNTPDAGTNTLFIGPWFKNGVVAGVAEDMAIVNAVAVDEFIAPRGGTIEGLTMGKDQATTAGVFRLQLTVTEDGTATVVDDYEWPLTELEYVPDDFTPYAFKRGARIKFGYDASAGVLPDATFDVLGYLEVKM